MASIYKAGNVNTSGSMDSAIQQTAIAKVLGRLNANLVVTNLITNRSSDARNQGSRYAATVLIPKTGAVSATNKVPGSPAVPVAATATQSTITINKHKTWDILVEDYGSLFSGPQLILQYAEDASAVLAEAIEVDVIGNYTSASRVISGASINANWSLVTLIRKYTRQDKWSQNGETNIVWGPNAEYALFGSDQWNKTYVFGTDQAGNSVVTGDLGTRLGMHHYTSNLMPMIAGSPSNEVSIAFQKDAIAICFVDMSMNDMPEELRAPTVKMVTMDYTDDHGTPIYSMRNIVGYSQLDRGMLVTYDTIYGTGPVRPEKLYALQQ